MGIWSCFGLRVVHVVGARGGEDFIWWSDFGIMSMMLACRFVCA